MVAAPIGGRRRQQPKNVVGCFWQILLQKSPIRSKAAQARKKLFLSFVPLAPRASGG
jgi:hypothetical protein